MITNWALRIARSMEKENIIHDYNICQTAELIEGHLLDFIEEAELKVVSPLGALLILAFGFLLGAAAGKMFF
jgi:hypothetical protein